MKPQTAYYELGQRLYKARRVIYPEVTKRSAARYVGVDPKTYDKWERGLSCPDVIQAEALFSWFKKQSR